MMEEERSLDIEAQRNLAIMNQLTNIYKQNGQDEEATALETSFQKFYNYFMTRK